MSGIVTVVYILAVVIVRCLFAWCCVSIARKKGRGVDAAIILGLFFGIWAVIGYTLASSNILKSESLNPSCPRCYSDTIFRVVLKGKDTGKKFYVCINYPKCKGRIPA
jgi:hypothetical protein